MATLWNKHYHTNNSILYLMWFVGISSAIEIDGQTPTQNMDIYIYFIFHQNANLVLFILDILFYVKYEIFS